MALLGNNVTGQYNRGATAVELAIVLPVLYMMMFGIIEFGLFLYDKQVMTNAVREGARTGIVMRAAPRDMAAEKSLIIDAVKNYSEKYLITFGAEKNPAIDTPVYENNEIRFGNELKVRATFDYTFLVLPNFVTSLAGAIRIESVSVMRME